MLKKWRELFAWSLFLLSCLVSISGCALDKKMDVYAEVRYRKAMDYMEASRFALAQEQFAIVAATANSPKLKQLGLDGYAKADTAIAVQR